MITFDHEVVRTKLLKEIAQERDRQDQKWGWPNAGMAGNDIHFKMSILTEEIGEVAQALNDRDYPHAREELIQCAAVIFAWLEYDWTTGELA